MKKTALFLGLFGAGVSISAAAATVLFDFETEDKQKTAPCVFAHDRTICVTNAFATSGQHALYFKSGPWRKGLDEWPSFNLYTSVKDWCAYDRPNLHHRLRPRVWRGHAARRDGLVHAPHAEVRPG